MAEQTQDSLGAKGSYELYDSQRRSAPPFGLGERNMHENMAFGAPGSPGSFPDHKQIATRLYKELEDRKRKEADLHQIINNLRQQAQHSNNPINTTNFADGSFMNSDGPSSNENLDESVKEAHLKYLQRQVTILQANLYKAQEWSTKATQEKAEAEEKLTSMVNEFSHLKRENESLHQRVADLTSNVNGLQKQLQHSQVQNQSQQTQRVIQLQELVSKQKSEITTLKESLQRLHEENKDPKSHLNPSLGNVACSQELEYLHKVVDTLKSTVVDQRNFLLKMRTPNSSQASSTLSTTANGQIVNGVLNSSHLACGYRGSSSPTLGRDGGSMKNGHSESGPYGHHSQGAVPKTPVQHKSSYDGGAPVLSSSDEGAVGGGNPLGHNYFQEMDLANPTACHTGRLDEGYVRLKTESDMEKLQGNLFQFPGDSNLDGVGQRPRSNLGGSSGSRALNGVVPPLPPREGQHPTLQRKTSHSEVIGRSSDLEQLNQQPQSKSEAIVRNSDRHLQATNDMSQWILNSAGQGIDSSAALTVGSGSLRNSPQRLVPVNKPISVKGRTQGLVHEAAVMPDLSMWQSGNNADVTPNLLDADYTGGLGHLKMDPSTSPQQQQIYHPPSNYQEGSVRVVNKDIMAGGRMTVPPAPSPHLKNRHALYMNTSPNNAGISSVDPDPMPPNLNSDRQCPVCNRDFSQGTVEDFQIHVFECFDDENAPETMKPQESLDRTCPMCGTKFGSSTTQEEFEGHVHSHFGEAPGENFEILQP